VTRTLQVSTANSAFQVLESLAANRLKRHRSRSFLVEGVRPLTTALARGWPFEAVVRERGARLSTWAADVIARAGAPVCYEMTPDLMARLSRKDEPSELIAQLRMPADDLGRIPVGPGLLAAVMDRPTNPGNLGTLIRSCDAFGLAGLVVTGHGVDVYDPATITSSRGSLFALPVVQAASHADVLAWIGSARAALGRCDLVGADEQGTADIASHDFSAPTVLVLGNETHGLSRAYRDACDVLVRIPMTGSASSLNVAVAGSIVLYEAQRQRRGAQQSDRAHRP
jgi:TrmH family RNA methyltransferase